MFRLSVGFQQVSVFYLLEIMSKPLPRKYCPLSMQEWPPVPGSHFGSCPLWAATGTHLASELADQPWLGGRFWGMVGSLPGAWFHGLGPWARHTLVAFEPQGEPFGWLVSQCSTPQLLCWGVQPWPVTVLGLGCLWGFLGHAHSVPGFPGCSCVAASGFVQLIVAFRLRQLIARRLVTDLAIRSKVKKSE